MNIIINLCNIGTIYLWIFVLKVLQVAAEYRTDTVASTGAGTLIMKPFPYQIFDEYTDELLNERNVAATTPSVVWQTKDKQLTPSSANYKSLTLAKAKTGEQLEQQQQQQHNGNAVTSNEITFENLNDFGSYKIQNPIWPRDKQQQQQQQLLLVNDDDNLQQQRHSCHKHCIDDGGGTGCGGGFVDKQRPVVVTNIRYKNRLLPIILGKRIRKKSNTFNDADADDKENIFPLKDNTDDNNGDEQVDDADGYDTLNANYAVVNGGRGSGGGGLTDENVFATSYGNGNEFINYSDNNKVNSNYLMAQSDIDNNDNNSKDDKKDHDNKEHHTTQILIHTLRDDGLTHKHDKRAKPSYGHTPFLPSVSGGAMTNLGKFFRDLSKNVHFSEQYQWGPDDQKLLEGDPDFGNIHHHITKPTSAKDQQTEEWIKAIRFYRPSQKIRSLVAMNPHGQWAHSSQFIDPNYMWVGLGK